METTVTPHVQAIGVAPGRAHFLHRFQSVLASPLLIEDNFGVALNHSDHVNQQQTNEAFTAKWEKYGKSIEQERLFEFQRRWFLELYGFTDEEELAQYLRQCDVVLDAGCGLGYKSEWFARLSPRTLVVGMDFSEAAAQAAERYSHLANLFFIQGDIARTGFRDASVSFVCCDQVIMHTEDPERTFDELVRTCRQHDGQIACYFYARKALPREMLDDHFRTACANMSSQQLWEMSEQLTELGRRLSELNVSFEAPAIPALGIKGGTYDLQRFVYWNFLKCFWNAELGFETSVSTNFDWYSPSNARRFDKAEVRALFERHGMKEVHFQSSEACYSARFRRAATDLASH